MKKYYIIRSDGSSLFEQPYSEDFIFHCLIKLLEQSDEHYRLLESFDCGTAARCISLLRSEEQNSYTLVYT